jgi:hypothetical protein
MKQMTHCAVEGAGIAFLSIEASFKGALLLFGCLMGFSTRKVAASFNESQTITWAIYNVFFSALVVGAILLFLDTLGDTLIWLGLILFVWLAAGTWALIFVPKATAVLYGDEKLQRNANSISLGSLSKHDGSITFARTTGLGRSQLLAYRTALEAQLDKVKRALGIVTAKADSEGKVLFPRSAGSELPESSVSSNATAGGRAWPKPHPVVDASHDADLAATAVTIATHLASPTASSVQTASASSLSGAPRLLTISLSSPHVAVSVDASQSDPAATAVLSLEPFGARKPMAVSLAPKPSSRASNVHAALVIDAPTS